MGQAGMGRERVPYFSPHSQNLERAAEMRFTRRAAGGAALENEDGGEEGGLGEESHEDGSIHIVLGSDTNEGLF